MSINENRTRPVSVGDTVSVTLPHSEVCMFMHVAGTRRNVKVLNQGAQILNDDGTPFSFPVTHGEAGVFYTDARGYYVTGAALVTNGAACATCGHPVYVDSSDNHGDLLHVDNSDVFEVEHGPHSPSLAS